ncbi:MAG: hypothetical protein GF341_04625, partial [candidate division Zixibacteria bacterium]|nr:hypothetical protein [candidate division Zixibacteria bacterium]
MRRFVMLAVLLVGAVALLVGCSDDDEENALLALSFLGVEDLGDDYVYEGWILVDGTPISTGTFTVDEMGVPDESQFMVNSAHLAAATKFILTIEPSPDPSPDPSLTKYLAGDFSGNSADLTVADGDALGTDFNSATGDYILNTPSTAGDDSDYTNGIWWLDPNAGPGPSLTLPNLPNGWVYEGWIVGNSGPISTGRFTSVSGDDSDLAGPTSGDDPPPPFPGQDFIDPGIDLTLGYAAVISVEPEP